MAKSSKAHTATVNRIARRYGGELNLDRGPDITTPQMVIEVETTATLHRGVRRLKTCKGPAYLAVTNKEALAEALRLTARTAIGVMDPRGNIVKPHDPA